VTPAPERVPLQGPLYVERAGRGDPLILLHGYAGSRVTWRHWVEDLARDYTVYLVDLRGFGSAQKVDPPRYGPGDMTDDVVRMILDLDLRNVTLIGHSIGGGIALLATLRLRDLGEGDRIRGIVSVAGVAYPQRFPHYVQKLQSARWQVLLGLVPTRWIVRKALESIVHDRSSVTDRQVEDYARPLRPWSAKKAAAASALQLVPADLDEIVARYPTIDVPALLLWGRSDPVVPLAIGQRLARELPNARLVVLERCGHLPPEELPRESLAVVTEFLERISRDS
jgi:pimeloyl-ACP methyl ester carboxylesterase